MQGLMQDQQLLISSLIEFANRFHGDAEIVSRRVEGDIHRYTYRDLTARAKQLANALDGLKLAHGDRVASLAWNGYRHMEMYYGVSGSGRVLHTINPRLHPEQIAWIVNHAEDQVLCFDTTFLPLIQAVHAKCPTVRQWVALCDADKLPTDSGIPGLVSYEAWIAGQSKNYRWPQLDENTASSMCYTSGTTGNPKAVLYSHRSSVLHAYGAALPDVMNLSARDAVLPVVPMFHVNAWGLPYSAALTGAKVVFPGPALDGKSLYDLIEAEGVTFAAGVPTVWQMLLTHMQQGGLKFSHLNRTVIGGSACPPAMIDTFEDTYGVRVLHAWGMTEMSPLGTLGTLKNKHLALPKEQQRKILQKQGRPIYGVDMRIVDSDGRDQPWDGKACGDLLVRGPWILDTYYKGASPLVKDEEGRGWFPTGDVATIDPDGYMQITDRTKDVIKSGGEWISSIDIENIAMGHPAVAMAACIGMPHPKWDERPIVAVAKKAGAEVSREELLAFFDGKTAKWQIPDDVVFVDAIPLGATGKMLKTKLREQLAGYKLPGL
ncbi:MULTISPECIES: 3-(methylthio)propionyl-CoA ligase [Comamonas]|jgi:fatty-acyl-CoA synthase|uniref:Long-chain fatty acid--CoA ligase n=1 Tax=Comamonas terrigena TaxID=32013 RepID=A0A2A7UWR0_COMTR|nr:MULTISPECIES: 3-(methylthio)propionyl-CoA ligase [Comamonas]MBV7417390.1 fatty-acid--CoA ligase [Comamonas sp. CMM03]PEH89684.1 long-chain fatty acid--CoA ligase [Comamonas terrigena]BBL24897.1 long-chain-fatty-acid--CoA ligase [Comamonas terrigena NBRC 13299]SUY71510.1 Long-chain-fatty-acid--CoA ligase [Comamonas terrigena]